MPYCHTSISRGTIAASSTMMRRYLRPLATSGLSRLQNSSKPPVMNSSRRSCTLRRERMGANVRTASRHTSSSILYEGLNQPTGYGSDSGVTHRSRPSAVLPARRPTSTTLKRDDSRFTCLCHSKGLGRISRIVFDDDAAVDVFCRFIAQQLQLIGHNANASNQVTIAGVRPCPFRFGKCCPNLCT